MQETAQKDTASLRKTWKEQIKPFDQRLSYKKILAYASKLWHDQATAKAIATEASQIIHAVNKRNRVFFSGKSEKGLLSGLFYLLSIKNNAKKTQRELARSLNTNDVTVRAFYRDWLKIYPELSHGKDNPLNHNTRR
jgi:transcription initiation factor TFIIIB Brf1 subunit/transcription initiation factor TFIIB